MNVRDLDSSGLDTSHSWALVNIVSEISVSMKDEEFVKCCGISNFSRTALLLVGSLLVCLKRYSNQMPVPAWTCPEGCRRLMRPDFQIIGT